jgi:ssDNA-binding Zn-finger/Zn-ribbon topoisomerase 1
MSDIIDKLKENTFNNVKKSNIKCPICNSDLYIVNNWMLHIMDGNTVFYCENNENHKFWKNAREKDNILHLNKNASSTNFDSEQDFSLINDKWVKC